MSALVFLAPGFEEIEAVTIVDVLRRADIETVVAGLVTNPITASRRTRHLADLHLADLDPATVFEIVILPGGAEGAAHLAASPLVGQWLVRQHERGGWIAALCAAPIALLAHGVLSTEARLTCHPSVRERFGPGQIQDSRVVTDGRSITGQAAGSALEFAFEIVRRLRGEDKVREIDRGLCSGLPAGF